MGDRGVVNLPADPAAQTHAVVRIGSTLSDDHSLTGRQLASGDEVEILGERVLTTESGAMKMLQIVPPPREYRWVKGNFIVPLDPTMRARIDSDPYAVPSSHRTPEQLADIPESALEAPSLSAPKTPDVVQTAHQETAVAPERLRLIDIDNEYADMMMLDVSAWRLDDLRAKYHALKAEAPSAVVRQIDVRLAALDGRQKIYDRYARFARITAETDARDQQLLAILGQAPAPALAQEAGAAPGPTVELGAPSQLPSLASVDAKPLTVPSLPALPTLRAPVEQASGAATQPATDDQMDGAGIVQATAQATQGVPRHFLIAPDGRFLAFLESSVVNLDQYVGQSLGFYGNRARDPRYQADLIDVVRVAPVQLTR
jgi:hypothetical protein